ncbi:hypothetical protein CPB85DRAFT_1442935 [Mucidula mucida]|nr:hypothetical protein CPB85DRAFT_1442935 [Mucidula mucida]
MPPSDPVAVVVAGTRLAPPIINQTSDKLTDKHFNMYLKQCTSWLAAVHPKADPKKVVPLLAPELLHQTLETYYDTRAKQLDSKTVEEYVDALKARSHGPEHYKHIHENLKKAKQGNLHVNDWYKFVIVAADKLASSKKYALTDRDRITTIRDGLSVRMKNKLLERRDVEDYGDTIADGSNTDAEKWTKYQDRLQEIQELINAQEENKANDGRARSSVASTRENFGGIPNPAWSGASLPAYVAPQLGSAHFSAVAAVTADAGVRTLKEWFTIRYIVNGCLQCWLPWQNHRGADNKCREPPPDGEHTLKWCFNWAAANPSGFENAALAPGFQPRQPTSVSADDIANMILYNMHKRQLKPHLVPEFYRRYKPDLFINAPAPQVYAPGSRRPTNTAQRNNYGHATGSNTVPIPTSVPPNSGGYRQPQAPPAPSGNFAVPPPPTGVGVLFQHSSYDIPDQRYNAWQSQRPSANNVASIGGCGRQNYSHSTAAVMGEYPNNNYESSDEFTNIDGGGFSRTSRQGDRTRGRSPLRQRDRARARSPLRSRNRSSEHVTRARQATDSPRYERRERKLPTAPERKDGRKRPSITEEEMRTFASARLPSPLDRLFLRKAKDARRTVSENDNYLPELIDATDNKDDWENASYDPDADKVDFDADALAEEEEVVGAVIDEEPSVNGNDVEPIVEGNTDVSNSSECPIFLPHLVWKCAITDNSRSALPQRSFHALLDDGSPFVLIRPEVVDTCKLRRRKLPKPIIMDTATPSNDSCTTITEYVDIQLFDPSCTWTSRSVRALIAPGLCYPIILGLPFHPPYAVGIYP